jgi:putative glycosyltransferase (TIGR04372 family)
METRAIGHFSVSMEIFLCEVDLGIHKREKGIFLWFPNRIIANKYLLKKWKEILTIVPEFIFYPIYYFFRYFNLNRYFLIPYRHWTMHHRPLDFWQAFDKYSTLVRCKPHIEFSEDEINRGRIFLRNNKIEDNEKFVCFFAREPYYRPHPKLNFGEYSSRDSSILDQIPAMEHLVEKNYKIFRMGSVVKLILPKINDKIIDYANSDLKSDFLDLFLLTNCHFMVSTNSGIDCIPLLNRKKVLYVNFAQLENLPYFDNSFYPLFIPKKFKSLANGNLLSYSEVFKLKLNNILIRKDLQRVGFDWEDNSKSEILEAVIEMEKYINKQDYSVNLSNLKKKFNDIYYQHFNYKLKNINICESFLLKNQTLIN